VRDLQRLRHEAAAAFLAACGFDADTKAEPKKQGLTPEQIAAIRAAIAELDASAYAASLYDDTSDLVHVAYRDAAELLEVGAEFDVPPVWAIEHVKDAADHVRSLLEERDRAALTKTLDDALIEGLGARETADRLRSAFDDVAAPDRTTRADAWFDMVARTELQDAANTGQRALYDAAGVEKVRWQAAEPCDECAQYDDEVYALDDVPEDGPPIHPNCRCVLVPMDEDLGDWRGTQDDRDAARRGNQPDDEE
jgi:SPP1 gp7 family putative phage head morphogenesis protein